MSESIEERVNQCTVFIEIFYGTDALLEAHYYGIGNLPLKAKDIKVIRATSQEITAAVYLCRDSYVDNHKNKKDLWRLFALDTSRNISTKHTDLFLLILTLASKDSDILISDHGNELYTLLIEYLVGELGFQPFAFRCNKQYYIKYQLKCVAYYGMPFKHEHEDSGDNINIPGINASTITEAIADAITDALADINTDENIVTDISRNNYFRCNVEERINYYIADNSDIGGNSDIGDISHNPGQ